ncbi:torsin-1A-interacting protein 1-like [Odontesthes bonariensis]|uniref:torsin-1A-interacting protein 1-like n=1 Tax=Odontesthes bonariensis TaxID=219752 RepID=UPI003F587D3D
MDSTNSKNKVLPNPRRSTRQSSGKALSVEPTPRPALKRTKNRLQDPSTIAVVNGASDVENGLEDEESPKKKSRLDTEGAHGDSVNENEMDVQEVAEEAEKNEDLKMDIVEDFLHDKKLPKISKDAIGDLKLTPRVVLGERCKTVPSVYENPDRLKPKRETKESRTKSAVHVGPPEIRRDVQITTMDEYKRTMEAKARSTDKTRVNHFVPSAYSASEKTYTTRQRLKNIPAQKPAIHLKKQEGKNKSAVTKRSSQNPCRGFMWYIWRLVFLVLLSSATLLAYKILPVLQKTADGGGHPSRDVMPEKFADLLSLLETQFPSQRPELWKRSKIHLEKHLKAAQPTEPVSLIFTAGLGAERTLYCLARSLASSYSSALNASVLHLDGVSKASQDSDEVKLNIDNQLQAAFEGDKPVAVIHRFEELPPGSTLIFYRYCDHENAAYKKVFLLFTVLLPEDEIRGQLSLKEVEEMVHEYVVKKLVGSTNEAAYNKMDIDKFGGLWSRISHLILPVVSEVEVEHGECP